MISVVLRTDDMILTYVDLGDGTIKVQAKDTKTNIVMESTAPLVRFPLLHQYQQVAQAMVDGIRPQLDAHIQRTLNQPSI